MKVCLFAILALMSTLVKAEYFYFWAENYETTTDVDGRAYVSTRLKTSELSNFDFSVNGVTIMKDVEVLPNEVVDFPFIISKKYTENKEYLTLCSFKHQSKTDFKQEICLKIDLYQ